VRLAFPLCLLLQGCFAFWVPLPRSDSAGNTCVDTSAYVGQRIKNDDGRMGTLKPNTSGRSSWRLTLVSFSRPPARRGGQRRQPHTD
jgi:hypothetical protein